MTDRKPATEVEADKEAGRRLAASSGEESGRIRHAQASLEPKLPRGVKPDSLRGDGSKR